MNNDHAFDTVSIIVEDIDSYIEERRWDETSNGDEARDKNFDLVMARSMRIILPQMEHVKNCKRNPSLVMMFRQKTGVTLTVISGIFLGLSFVYHVLSQMIGVDALLLAWFP